MLSNPMYVAGMPNTELVKQIPESHPAENLQLTYGHKIRVRVEPNNPIEIIDWDCCIRQYWRITHFLKGLISELVMTESQHCSLIF